MIKRILILFYKKLMQLLLGNINHIKDVVNNLADELTGIVSLSNVFRYFRFNVPENLLLNKSYKVNFQLSENQNFNEPFVSGDSEIFTSVDANKAIKVDLYSVYSSYSGNSFPFYGRLKLVNVTDNLESDWKGFVLSFSK